MSPELTTLLIGASPIAEVRGAIPIAIGVFHFSALKAYWISVAGNLLPIIPFFFFLKYFSRFLMERVYLVNRFLTWIFERTRRLHGAKFETWSMFALFVFVAIPLPLTGVYSGVVAAFLFGLPFWRSVFAISLGAAAAGVAVLLVTMGIITIL